MTELRRRFTLPRLPWWLGACLFAAIGVFFLWEEHRVHILGALPWLLLLACLLIHGFLHGGHGHSHSGPRSAERDGDGPSRDHGGVP